jgi:hypothetical protein
MQSKAIFPGTLHPPHIPHRFQPSLHPDTHFQTSTSELQPSRVTRRGTPLPGARRETKIIQCLCPNVRALISANETPATHGALQMNHCILSRHCKIAVIEASSGRCERCSTKCLGTFTGTQFLMGLRDCHITRGQKSRFDSL